MSSGRGVAPDRSGWPPTLPPRIKDVMSKIAAVASSRDLNRGIAACNPFVHLGATAGNSQSAIARSESGTSPAATIAMKKVGRQVVFERHEKLINRVAVRVTQRSRLDPQRRRRDLRPIDVQLQAPLRKDSGGGPLQRRAARCINAGVETSSNGGHETAIFTPGSGDVRYGATKAARPPIHAVFE